MISDDLSRRILSCLADAHRNGAISVSVEELSEILKVNSEAIQGRAEQLRSEGLLDTLEVPDQLCLSAAGFRREREQLSDQLSLTSEIPSFGDPLLLPTIDELMVAIRAHFESVTNSSSLGNEEKRRLISLAQELFQHPASLELFRRALHRGRTPQR